MVYLSVFIQSIVILLKNRVKLLLFFDATKYSYEFLAFLSFFTTITCLIRYFCISLQHEIAHQPYHLRTTGFLP